MKLVLTLAGRNEADVLDANLAFHLAAGVDLVIAADHRSDHGTAEILESYERSGRLQRIGEPDLGDQNRTVSDLARLAATELGADWVIDSDAHEFWWPRGGSLKQVLAAVPRRFGSVRGMRRNFVPRPEGGESFAERMTVRLCRPVANGDSPFSPHAKEAQRVSEPSPVPLAGWYPIDILHFPIRSLEQGGRSRELHEAHAVDDAKLEAGLRDGTLALDTRLRDALRLLSAGAAEKLDFSDPVVERCYVSEFGALEEEGAAVRAERRIASLERRLAALEASLPARLRSQLSRVSRRR
jgi:hypothetical protein